MGWVRLGRDGLDKYSGMMGQGPSFTELFTQCGRENFFFFTFGKSGLGLRDPTKRERKHIQVKIVAYLEINL